MLHITGTLCMAILLLTGSVLQSAQNNVQKTQRTNKHRCHSKKVTYKEAAASNTSTTKKHLPAPVEDPLQKATLFFQHMPQKPSIEYLQKAIEQIEHVLSQKNRIDTHDIWLEKKTLYTTHLALQQKLEEMCSDNGSYQNDYSTEITTLLQELQDIYKSSHPFHAYYENLLTIHCCTTIEKYMQGQIAHDCKHTQLLFDLIFQRSHLFSDEKIALWHEQQRITQQRTDLTRSIRFFTPKKDSCTFSDFGTLRDLYITLYETYPDDSPCAFVLQEKIQATNYDGLQILYQGAGIDN